MLSVYVALANMSGEVAPSDLAAYLEQKLPNSSFNAPEPQPNTKGSADIIGILATIGSTADIYTLASALQDAYFYFIHPYKGKNPSSALAVCVEENGESASLMINADTSKEIIITGLSITPKKVTAELIRIKR